MSIAEEKRRANFVRMFKPQFASLVEAGTKRQTVRPTPKRMPKPGDTISLRAWTGKPYRSKQRVLRNTVIKHVIPIHIDRLEISIINGDGTRTLFPYNETQFARDDGFTGWPEMRDWFDHEHGLPFLGILITWR